MNHACPTDKLVYLHYSLSFNLLLQWYFIVVIGLFQNGVGNVWELTFYPASVG